MRLIMRKNKVTREVGCSKDKKRRIDLFDVPYTPFANTQISMCYDEPGYDKDSF